MIILFQLIAFPIYKNSITLYIIYIDIKEISFTLIRRLLKAAINNRPVFRK